jgi:multidrug transporter EmrE-like cation transporter
MTRQADNAGRSRVLAACALWVLLPLLSVGYQIAAKEAAHGLAGIPFGWHWIRAAISTPWVQGLIVCEIVSFCAWMMVLAEVKLSTAFSMTALNYVLVIAASWIVFHEVGNALQIMGGSAIIAGVWLIGRTPEAMA